MFPAPQDALPRIWPRLIHLHIGLSPPRTPESCPGVWPSGSLVPPEVPPGRARPQSEPGRGARGLRKPEGESPGPTHGGRCATAGGRLRGRCCRRPWSQWQLQRRALRSSTNDTPRPPGPSMDLRSRGQVSRAEAWMNCSAQSLFSDSDSHGWERKGRILFEKQDESLVLLEMLIWVTISVTATSESPHERPARRVVLWEMYFFSE